MSSSKRYIDQLREKPESTKNVIAAVLALIPALLIGYAQFYMNSRASNQETLAKESTVKIDKREMASAFESISKIFNEGKASVGEAISGLEKIDEKILLNNNLETENNFDTTKSVSTGTLLVDDEMINKPTE